MVNDKYMLSFFCSKELFELINLICHFVLHNKYCLYLTIYPPSCSLVMVIHFLTFFVSARLSHEVENMSETVL